MSSASAFAEGTHPDQVSRAVFVTAPDGLRLHIRSYGSSVASALPVVCLPALARTAADFHPLATELAADPANPRLVLALDYRGHGQSEYDRNPTTTRFLSHLPTSRPSWSRSRSRRPYSSSP